MRGLLFLLPFLAVGDHIYQIYSDPTCSEDNSMTGSWRTFADDQCIVHTRYSCAATRSDSEWTITEYTLSPCTGAVSQITTGKGTGCTARPNADNYYYRVDCASAMGLLAHSSMLSVAVGMLGALYQLM